VGNKKKGLANNFAKPLICLAPLSRRTSTPIRRTV